MELICPASSFDLVLRKLKQHHSANKDRSLRNALVKTRKPLADTSNPTNTFAYMSSSSIEAISATFIAAYSKTLPASRKRLMFLITQEFVAFQPLLGFQSHPSMCIRADASRHTSNGEHKCIEQSLHRIVRVKESNFFSYRKLTASRSPLIRRCRLKERPIDLFREISPDYHTVGVQTRIIQPNTQGMIA